VQWATRPNCRRCGVQLPQPVINVVEVEKPVPMVQKEILEVLALHAEPNDAIIG
jgi:hypothetical protein